MAGSVVNRPARRGAKIQNRDADGHGEGDAACEGVADGGADQVDAAGAEEHADHGDHARGQGDDGEEEHGVETAAHADAGHGVGAEGGDDAVCRTCRPPP